MLSNNQSSFTRCVLETCLKVGLGPFMIILITASLSSNTKKDAHGLEMCAFGGTKSMLSVTLLSAVSEFVF